MIGEEERSEEELLNFRERRDDPSPPSPTERRQDAATWPCKSEEAPAKMQGAGRGRSELTSRKKAEKEKSRICS